MWETIRYNKVGLVFSGLKFS